MSEEWGQKKLPPEEGRYDSGIADSVQSLSEFGASRFPSLPEAEEPKLQDPPPRGADSAKPGVVEAHELDRTDSVYGSSSITESLSATCVLSIAPQGGKTDAEGVRREEPQELEGLSYLSEEGDTILHLAVIHSMQELALYFIAVAPKDVLDIQNDLYQTPLHLAVYLDQVKVVESLVEKGVNLELQDRKGNTALHVACENQHLDSARILLQGPRGPQNLHLQNWNGLACLHIATMKRDLSLTSLLLEHGADINDQEGTSGKTPLHLAVEMLDSALLAQLLQHRPQVDALMYNGCTPLHLAVGRKDAGLARLLCQAGADTLQRNREGDTPQDLAEGNNQLLALLPFDDLKISGKPVVTSA
ncbi:NF-kappa-B inhibitor epsilon [Spea bombifrons]|uniref:NF-kappa-B inhibitor epsilon n=1 Tax=Spea bombifrons TaxID=233779 RepID=UPI0023499F3E|nr:NF-kappa-B inhibitor epsilon [Spea bombifrons]